MIIELPRHERENIEPRGFECLVYGGRLVNSPRYRFEIVNVEDPWVEITVPANDIQWMEAEDIGHERVVDLNSDLKLSLVGMGYKLIGTSKVSVAEWGQFSQLTIVVPIASGNLDRSCRLCN